jgi:hypothetical protein
LVATAHARGLEVMVWVLKPQGLDHELTWNALASRGVDLFTSDLPSAALEWWQQQQQLKLLQLKLLKQQQPSVRRTPVPIPVPIPHLPLVAEDSGHFEATTPPDGSVLQLYASAFACVRPCCAQERLRTSNAAGDLILHASPSRLAGVGFGSAGQKLKPMPKFRRLWAEGSAAALPLPSPANTGPALRSAYENLPEATSIS